MHLTLGFEGLQMRKLGQRPPLEGSDEKCPKELQRLISMCWTEDPPERPTAQKVLKLLKNISGT